MPEPMKIRTVRVDGATEIRVLIPHPMETGLRKDPSSGALIPAHFIQTLTVRAKGKVVVEGQLNTAVARNPLFAFRVRDLQAGDPVSISWTDNRGESRTDEIRVSE